MHEVVKEYYGKTLTGSEDLKTDACCTPDAMPDHIKPILGSIHEEVLGRYYGCGLVVPEAIEGLRILDLGCGAGRDVYALAGLTGEVGVTVADDDGGQDRETLSVTLGGYRTYLPLLIRQ